MAAPAQHSHDRRVIRGRTCGQAVQLVTPERSSGAGRGHTFSPTCRCTRGWAAPKFVQSKKSDSSAASFKLLSNHTNIPPHNGSVASLRHRRAFKENAFPELFSSSFLTPPCTSGTVHLLERCWYSLTFICRQRRRGRGLASFTNICGGQWTNETPKCVSAGQR